MDKFEEWLLNGKQGDAITLFEIFKAAPEDGSGARTKRRNNMAANGLKELYSVTNSGEEGYFLETAYYTRKKDAFNKVAHWLNIGDRAAVGIVNVTPDVYK